jgi:uncharacterized membrane-anchored protein
MKKIPELTALFWLTKITATTLGETGGDLFSMTLTIGYGLCSILFFAFFLFVVTFQLSLKKYIPSVFWLVILSTSTAGTTLSDYMDRTLGLGYAKGSLLLFGLLALTLILWKWSQKSLSVTHVLSFKAELFYWTAILFSNTLGTALGDYLADDSGLGFAGGAIVIGGALVIIVLLHYFTKVSSVVLFWMAFVLTRPFGATFGDLLTKTTEKGGLNYGTLGASIILLLLMIALVIYETLQISKKRVAKAHS